MTLLEAIMNRDQCSVEEAEQLIDYLKEQIEEGEDPEEVLYNEGFEPDYIFELIF